MSSHRRLVFVGKGFSLAGAWATVCFDFRVVKDICGFLAYPSHFLQPSRVLFGSSSLGSVMHVVFTISQEVILPGGGPSQLFFCCLHSTWPSLLLIPFLHPATCFVHIVAIIMTAIMIIHIRSKYTAVGESAALVWSSR